MTMKWFGPTWHAPVNTDLAKMETPVDSPCTHCEEPIAAGDRGLMYSNGPVAHLNCFLRVTVGGVAHQLKTCSCYGGSENDPPELTKRQAANLAVELWEKNERDKQ